jgi:hypothetical protein
VHIIAHRETFLTKIFSLKMFSKICNAFKAKHVLLSEVKNAAIITINRPEKLNSFTTEMPK